MVTRHGGVRSARPSGHCSKCLSSRARAATVPWTALKPKSMRAWGAGSPAGLLALGWLILVGLQASQASNVTSSSQDPSVARAGESENESENEPEEEAENEGQVTETETTAEAEEEIQNRTIVKEVELGMCRVKCGVGIREVILTNGCPRGESKCVRMEECRGPVDCGWGSPHFENLESARLSCVHIFPENRFKYIWKLLKPNQEPVILTNDSAVLEVTKELDPLVFECDTLDHNELVASVKFLVYRTSELQMRKSNRQVTRAVLVVGLPTGVISVYVLFKLIFIIKNWVEEKLFGEAEASTTEIQSEMSSNDSTSLDQSPAEIPVHEGDALSE